MKQKETKGLTRIMCTDAFLFQQILNKQNGRGTALFLMRTLRA